MTSTPGPPLHSRFSESEARAAVVQRYRTLKDRVSAQVAALQECPEFRLQASHHYERGLPDWTIVNSIATRVLAIELTKRGKRAAKRKELEKVLRARGEISSTIYPCSDFLGDVFESQLQIDQFAMLKGYGFMHRCHIITPAVIERFLMERMKHFDFDLPHPRLFGRPPGSWPEIPQS